MSAFSATPNQLRAMNEKGNRIVSAAAGAGKTSVLTRRIAGLIKEGTGIDRMLILTFTRAAAQEMRQRIEKELKKMVEEEQDPAARARLMTEADAAGSAYISTIDSFCSRILRRYGHRVDLPAAIRVGDEIELAVIAADVEDELLHRLGAENDPDYALLLSAFNGESTVWESILALNDFLDVRPDPDGWLQALAERERRPEYAEEMLRLHVGGLRFLLESALEGYETQREAVDPAYKKICDLMDNDLMALRGAMLQEDPDVFREALAAYDWPGKLVFPKDVPDEEKQPAQNARKELKETVKALLKKLSRTKEEEFALMERGAGIEQAFIRITLRYRETLLQEKLSRNVIGFSDAEHFALKILSDPEVAAEYRRQFEYIAVDEYQDSNDLQEELLNRIKREDNVFLVGDVKQSIYRFRAAEPGLFLKKSKDPASFGGELISLKENFRSHPDILYAVNSVFSAVMTERVGEMDYTREALEPGLENALPGGAELHLIAKNLERRVVGEDAAEEPEEPETKELSEKQPEEDPQKSAEKREREELEDAENAVVEARFIAKRIHELMETEGIDHGDKAGVTAYRYSDFAVLMRTGVQAEAVAAELAANGIPAFVQASGGFFDAVEVQVLLNLLRVIDNRRQDIPLASALRSPVFGFTDEEFARLRVLEPAGSFYEAYLSAANRKEPPEGEEALYQKIGAAEDYLEKKRFESTLVGISELVAGIIDETHYYEIIGAEPAGRQRRRNLDAFVEQAQKFENAGGSGIWRFVTAMDSTSKASAAAVGAAQESAGDVVRIMTVHKSKGLEFPVVFFAESAKKFHGSDNKHPLKLHGGCGIGMRFVEKGVRYETVTYKAISEKLRLEDLSEEMRVLYVALTRARQRLIVVGTVANPNRYVERHTFPCTPAKAQRAISPMDWVVYGYRSAPALWPLKTHLREEFLPTAGQPEEKRQPEKQLLDITELRERFSWRYPYENSTALPAKQSVSHAISASALNEKEPPVFEEPSFLSGKTDTDSAALRGTVVHLILKTLPKEAKDEESVRAHVDDMLRTGVIEEEETDAVRTEDLVWFANTPLRARLNAAEVQRREWNFTRRIPARECIYGPEGNPVDSDEPVLLQGVIDCCFVEDGAWVLLDYKTDRVRSGTDAAAYAEKHRRQLELYADALTALTGKPVKEKLLVLLAWHEVVRM